MSHIICFYDCSPSPCLLSFCNSFLGAPLSIGWLLAQTGALTVEQLFRPWRAVPQRLFLQPLLHYALFLSLSVACSHFLTPHCLLAG
ncbi:hypothetical protein BDR04DRAFT_802710 [Suillus decipiens]|nr:hypothetical protein BDR04DRAFT_802710 [Suillus decipiens]